VESKGTASVENVIGHSQRGQRSLAIRFKGVAPGRTARVATPTFTPSIDLANYFDKRGYALVASPTLYPGQTVRAGLFADDGNERPVDCRLYIRMFRGQDDQLVIIRGPRLQLAPGAYHEFSWRIDDTAGAPISEVGLEISSANRANGAVYLDYLTWGGSPDMVLTRPATGGSMWRRAWVNGVDEYGDRWSEPYRLVQNSGRGLLIQGTREWTDYHVTATLNLHMVKAAGIAARVQGMRRYYALLLCNDGKARLIRALGGDTTLAETDYAWQYGEDHKFDLRVVGNLLTARIDDRELFSVVSSDVALKGGGVALVCEEGRVASDAVTVRPAA
jgi:hypothetical protein